MYRAQCFNCGTIEERNEDEIEKIDNKSSDMPNEVDKGQTKEVREIKCKQCGESKWIKLGEEIKPIEVDDNILTKISFFLSDIFSHVNNFLEETWNRITDVISLIIVYVIVLWRSTTLQRQKILNKITAFISCIIGIYLIDYFFHVGYEHSAILIVVLYILFKFNKFGE